MRKLLNKPWFVGVLALGAVALIASSLWPEPTRGRQGAPSPALDLADADEESNDNDSAATTPGAHATVREALAALVFPAVLNDPFARRGATLVTDERETQPVAVEVSESVLLSAIWQQAGADLVLVNDRILAVGDIIGRLTIEAITLDGMWVTHWKGRDLVTLGAAFTLITPVRDETRPVVAIHER